MQEKINAIKTWLGEGSVNIFGLPMSGKDTQGIRLAEALDGKFLSSGMIIRAMEEETKTSYTANGDLAPTNLFYEWVLPYFERRDLWGKPLILSSIGRWSGEETQVMSVAAGANHPVKAVIFLDLTEPEILKRWQAAKTSGDRGDRPDDLTPDIFKNRINEFQAKTVPVLKHYRELGLLLKIPADQTRDEVFSSIVDALYDFAQQNP